MTSTTKSEAMQVMVVQHVPAEGPGGLANWAADRDHKLTVWPVWDGLPATLPSEVAALVSLGGPMGADDDADHAWMSVEKGLIRQAIDRGLPVLGICLGAQLIARVLGAAVTRNPVTEIGWWPISAAVGHAWFADWPTAQAVLHWHGDTFALPDGAVHCQSSAHCAHQSYIWRDRVLGLQYHLEQDVHTLADLIAAEHHQAGDGFAVQAAADLRAGMASHGVACRQRLDALLDQWIVSAVPPLSPATDRGQ